MSSELYIGMISGTSRDGVDAVLVDFEEQRPDLLMARCVPYPEALRAEVDRLITAGQRPAPGSTRNLDRQLGHFFARIANDLVRDAGLEARDVRAVGSHGQTVWHEPGGQQPISVQLGNGFVIANVTRITTVTDFRNSDVAAGGQGAPLAPLLHRELFASDSERRAVLNLGGISNITLLNPGQPVRGFDCGPANCLLDLWIQRHEGADFDDGGSWAAGGDLHGQLLGRMLSDPYFAAPAPKSTGLELFNATWLDRHLQGLAIRPRDVQRTLAELSVQTITDALHMAGGTAQLLVCGGGVHNRFIMARLADQLGEVPVQPSQALGIHPDWVEASLFAWLARERIHQRSINTGSITGAREPVLLGEISEP
jgi:anhydro-N-acetylmuramic acid kinase